MKKKKMRVIYKSLWNTSTEEQKKESQQRIDQAFDIIFSDIELDLTDKSNNEGSKFK